MDTTVWTFLIIVVIFSIVGYFLLKRYSTYYAKKKTDRIIEKFMAENDIPLSDKSFEEVERELLLQEERQSTRETASKGKKKKKKKDGTSAAHKDGEP